jgi:hypothetical protein
MSLSVVIVGSWLSGDDCEMLTADCWMSLLVVAVIVLGCRVSVAEISLLIVCVGCCTLFQLSVPSSGGS